MSAPSTQLQSFTELLKLFEALPPSSTSTPSLTFMEVTGYPHYENVCSNILAFFLDTSGEHQMGSLMLESLLDLIPTQDPPVDLTDFNIEREYSTPNNQRIDLVLEGNTHVIAIENKVYHWLANDLGHYSETVETLAGKERTAIKLVLAPLKLPQSPGHGFLSITYRELWQQVQARIGNHLATAHPKWLTFLIDFIETSDRFIPSEKMELNNSDHFFIAKQAEIKDLLAQHNSFQDKLQSQAKQLRSYLSENLSESIKDKVTTVRHHQKHIVIIEYQLCGHKVALDLLITPHGWDMSIISRNRERGNFLQKILPTWKETAHLTIQIVHTKFKNLPLDTEITELHQFAEATLLDLTNHARTFPPEAENNAS